MYDDPSEPVELGAGIFVEANRILYNAAKEFGLELVGGPRNEIRRPGGVNAPEFGVWNGEKFVYMHDGQNQWWDLSKLMWRYGILAPMRTDRLVKATIGRFLRLYDEWLSYESLTDAADRLGLTALTSVSGGQLLKSHSIGDKFANEIVQAGTRVNYAQNISYIHGLESMVSMAGSGAMSVRGGNWQIFAKMLQMSSAEINLDSEVITLERTEDGLWKLEINQRSIDGIVEVKSETFDSVVIASPFQYAGLEIEPAPSRTPIPVPYVELHVTLFTSPHELSANAFKLSTADIVPNTILTTLPSSSNGQHPLNDGEPDSSDEIDFFSISTLRSVYNQHLKQNEYLYKIFSASRFSDTHLCQILGLSQEPLSTSERCGDISSIVTWKYEKTWNAYPYEYPRHNFEPHWLADNLWYTGGMDSFISTMETNALMGRKVGHALVERWMHIRDCDA